MAQTTYPTPDSWRTTLNLDALEQQHGLPAGLLTEVIRSESKGDPQAQNTASGAAGLFQFMPDTASAYKIDPYDPQKAAPAAAQELATLYRKYNGSLDHTLAGWNWGQGRVDTFGLEKAPKETQAFVATVKSGLTPATVDDAALEAFSARHFPQAGAPAGAPPADLDAFSARHFPTSTSAPAPAQPDAWPTVHPNPDPTQPATLAYPGTAPEMHPPSGVLQPPITIEKASSDRARLLRPDMTDEALLTAIGVDPALVMQSRYYQPGMFGKSLVTPGSAGETLTRSFVGDIMHGVRMPLDAGAQMLTRGLETIGLTSKADIALTDAMIKLKQAEYAQTSRPTTVDLPVVGETNVGSLAGTMMVPLPGTRGVLPAGSSAVGRIASGTANGAIAGTVAGGAQPVMEPGTPGTGNDTFWQQKREQGEQGATVGAVTGATTSTASAVGNKAVNAARNLSPSYLQVEEALKAATGADGTVNERIFTAMLNITPGAKFAGQEKWEVDGLKNLMAHIQKMPGRLDTTMKALGGLTAFGVVSPKLAGYGYTMLGLARALYSTPQGRNWLIAASDLQPGSDAMSRLVEKIGSQLPRLLATDATEPTAPASAR